MFLKKPRHFFGQFEIKNIAARYRIYFHRAVIVTCFGLFLQPHAAAEQVTDETYIRYQVELQETLYQYSQDAELMKTKVDQLYKKYNPTSPDWQTYTRTLSRDPEKMRQMNNEVKKRLNQKGIGYGK